MKKYTFLLLAFFLAFSIFIGAHAMSVNNDNVSATPSAPTEKNSVKNGQVRAPSNDDMSSRSANKLNTLNNPTATNQKNILNDSTIPTATPPKATKTAANSPSCKTYDGNIYEKGDPGYKDCMSTVVEDQQGINNIP